MGEGPAIVGATGRPKRRVRDHAAITAAVALGAGLAVGATVGGPHGNVGKTTLLGHLG